MRAPLARFTTSVALLLVLASAAAAGTATSENDKQTIDDVDETITVVGIRAGEEIPVTKRDLDREEIVTRSYGQDVPSLLQHTPSMTWYSDSGVGGNYSYFSLRALVPAPLAHASMSRAEFVDSSATRAQSAPMSWASR